MKCYMLVGNLSGHVMRWILFVYSFELVYWLACAIRLGTFKVHNTLISYSECLGTVTVQMLLLPV